LKNKEAIIELFGGVIEKSSKSSWRVTLVSSRTGFRLGDNAEMCIIELVDFNELMLKDAKPVKKTTRRSRRVTGTASAVAEAKVDAPAAETKAEEPNAPEASEDSTEGETEEK